MNNKLENLEYRKSIDKFYDRETGELLNYNKLIKLGFTKVELKKLKKPLIKTYTERNSEIITNKNLKIFDFDSTLCNSPTPNPGIQIWEEKTGKIWNGTGWWGRADSLDLNVFDIQPIEHIMKEYERVRENSDNINIVMTGRNKKLKKEVKLIIDEKFKMSFDGIFCENGGTTLEFKLRELNKMVEFNVKSIEMWDDREKHHQHFVDFANSVDIPVIIHKVLPNNTLHTYKNKTQRNNEK